MQEGMQINDVCGNLRKRKEKRLISSKLIHVKAKRDFIGQKIWSFFYKQLIYILVIIPVIFQMKHLKVNLC